MPIRRAAFSGSPHTGVRANPRVRQRVASAARRGRSGCPPLLVAARTLAGRIADPTLLRVPPAEVAVLDRDLVAATVVDGTPVHPAIG
ncbi:hypothetical protein [Nocardia asiatica]|uniref:hypothetical protein n=1 Tax=Nocardia asiatica TaxID=209252 RepID=UPI003EDFCE57